MAVIGKIRKHSGWIVALIGLAIAGFILQDAFMDGGPRGKIPKFAVINGQEIKIEQFNDRVDQIAENFRRAQGDIPISEEDWHQIRERVWMTMVGEMLMERSKKRLGVTVTTKEMNDMFYGQFIHHHVLNAFSDPATGMFNRQQVMMFINNFSQYPIETQKQFTDLEVAIRDERLRSKYYSIIANAYYVPSFYANYVANKANSTATATVAGLYFADIPDSEITLADSDFRTYFNTNKSLFKRTETSRALDFVVFDVHPTENDLIALEKHANELFEEFKTEQDLPNFISAVSTERFDSIFLKRDAFTHPWDSILFRSAKGTYFAPERRRNRYEMAKLIDVAARPDSLKASHILITYRGSAGNQGQNRTKEQAQSIADSLRREVLRNRTQFAEIAQANSEDGSREVGGDLGWFIDGQMVKPFNEAVVKGNVGDIVVVETVFGFHVIEITGKTAPVQKVMAAFVYVPLEPSAATNKAVYTEVNQLFARSRDLTSLQEVMREAGFQVRQAEFVTEMDVMLPGLPNARSIVRWAYDKKTKIGDISPEIYEFENRYVLVGLRQIREKGYPTLDELKAIPEVQHAVRNEKKAEVLVERMNGALKTNRSFSALEAIDAEIETIDIVSFAGYSVGSRGYEPEVIGTLFGTQQNHLSNPIKGRSGVFAVEPLVFTPVPALEDVALMRQQMQMMFQRGMVENLRNAQENRAKIVDNRAFYF